MVITGKDQKKKNSPIHQGGFCGFFFLSFFCFSLVLNGDDSEGGQDNDGRRTGQDRTAQDGTRQAGLQEIGTGKDHFSEQDCRHFR